MAEQQPSVSPDDVLKFLKSEFVRRFWPVVIFLILLNLIAIGIGWPLLKHTFKDYLDQHLKESKTNIDNIRIEAASVHRDSNVAVTNANNATTLVNNLQKDVLETKAKLGTLQNQLEDLQRKADELPKLDNRWVWLF